MLKSVFIICAAALTTFGHQAPARSCTTNASNRHLLTDNGSEPHPILKGVRDFVAPGTPGAVVIWGTDAHPLIAGSSERDLLVPVAAAGTLGKGRIVAFSHTGMLSREGAAIGDSRRLIVNAVRWASHEKSSIRVTLQNCNLAEELETEGFSIVKHADKAWHEHLKLQTTDVVCLVGNNLKADEIKALAEFVASGGGLLAAQTAWAWKTPQGKSLEDNPLNKVFAPAGIAWTDGTSAKTGEAGFVVGSHDLDLLHAAKSLDIIVRAHEAKVTKDPHLAQASKTTTDAARALPRDDRLIRPRLADLLSKHRREIHPAEQTPLKGQQALLRTLLAIDVRDLQRLDAGQVRKHQAADTFPGAVAVSAPRIRREYTIDTRIPDWHSTALYAAAGEVITVSIDPNALDAGLRARIGAHKDHLWHKESWQRVPEITVEWPLSTTDTQIASAFGGPIYIVVPEKAKPGPVRLSIANAVEAPHFELGTTNVAEWKSTIRNHPAPWAELVGRKIIITVPSAAARLVDDPTDLMKHWDRIADAEDELATVANLERNRRPDRFVADVQISAGYMHSGYPIMTHLDAVDEMTQIEKLSKGSWGLFHELGHNHQSDDWTFDGTGEVTVNLFTLYAMQYACGRALGEGHEGLKNRDQKIGPYIALGAKFDKWKSDPFLALLMYVQLVEGFGWDTYKKVFAEYRSLAKSDRPKSDADERDQWMVRFSRNCGRNLGPFFQTWGVPTTDQARESIKDLPAWMPPGFPPE